MGSEGKVQREQGMGGRRIRDARKVQKWLGSEVGGGNRYSGVTGAGCQV